MRLETLVQSFERSLRAQGKSRRTVKTYTSAVTSLAKYLGPIQVEDLRRRDIEAQLVAMVDAGSKPNTLSTHYMSLRAFFKWLEEEEDIPNPMAGMKPPKIPAVPVRVLTKEETARLLKTCNGKDFISRRDHAILSLFIDTGMRNGELAALNVDDIDFELDVALIHQGKGGKGRAAPFGSKTSQALDRYLRRRADHNHSQHPGLWLGAKGQLNPDSIRRIVRQRGKEAGLPGLHPHIFRHSFAASWLEAGGQEGDLMQIAGWSSRDMLSRYGSYTASERARKAHRRLSPRDQI